MLDAWQEPHSFTGFVSDKMEKSGNAVKILNTGEQNSHETMQQAKSHPRSFMSPAPTLPDMKEHSHIPKEVTGNTDKTCQRCDLLAP